jgi:hypothetical protein
MDTLTLWYSVDASLTWFVLERQQRDRRSQQRQILDKDRAEGGSKIFGALKTRGQIEATANPQVSAEIMLNECSGLSVDARNPRYPSPGPADEVVRIGGGAGLDA